MGLGWEKWVDIGFIRIPNEISETVQELANKEISKDIRPLNKEKDEDNHVIRVYDKPWRSKRSRERWYDDKKWVDFSKPSNNVFEWAISTNYHSDDEREHNSHQFSGYTSAENDDRNHN
ncbi:hypothetical protein C2G38_2214269 [Gigaspora rosea]|uniref:Uncharacterized protein n=1 Tax=Gigaspora rosea TaxID=44941 RepID=A0A397UBE3_9GLOM|nr:hypothetical protein C2G38_2214269 [Gigaspora rosea]